MRQGSSYLDRGYDSDDESTTGRFHGRHTLSQSLAADPMTATFGDAYSPLRSAIRPGSFTFKSAQELGATSPSLLIHCFHLTLAASATSASYHASWTSSQVRFLHYPCRLRITLVWSTHLSITALFQSPTTSITAAIHQSGDRYFDKPNSTVTYN